MRTKIPQPPRLILTSPPGEEWIRLAALGITLILLVGCSGSRLPAPGVQQESKALKLRHQIMFQSADGTHVFEGYMIVVGDTLLVKAFAGPGVDLFTVVRGLNKNCGALHIKGLEGKMDIEAIGDDIARVYLGGCVRSKDTREARCKLKNEEMVETFDPDGKLIKREFPSAHGIGLSVVYESFEDLNDRPISTKITLSWGTSSNKMIIKTVDIEYLESVSPDLFDSC